MKEDKFHSEKTLVEQHAMERLSQVEKHQQKAYEKRSRSFPWKEIIMGIFFLIILIIFVAQNLIH